MLESADNVNELLQDIKKHSLSFSKYYSKLASSEISSFMYKDSEIQSIMLEDIYKTNSRLEQLLREIIEYEVNAETIRKHEQGQRQGKENRNDGAETEEEYDD